MSAFDDPSISSLLNSPLIFGEAVGDLDDDDHDTFSRSFDYASYICAIRLSLADFCWAYSPSKFRRSCATVKRYANHFVQRALKDVEENGEDKARERYLFILDLYKELQDPGMVCDQLVNVLIAGRDTTACLLSWAFYCLVRHPDVLQRLRVEIQSMTDSPQGLTRAHILKLPYLKCVLNESEQSPIRFSVSHGSHMFTALRLYPQLPVNVRVATRTTMLPRGGGPDGQSPVLIPRGTGIGYSVYHMHQHTNLYGADAAAFNPARWEDSKLAKIGPGFMPFHAGPRVCLGKDFALTEASFAIVRLIQAFPNLRLPPKASTDPIGQERQSLTIVVSSADGCKVLL
ncbi:hypothetical protein VE03_01521 [Pseudogymnoascus sp. 23342-1-I1]|nr:hypothetical protein VE03_01521 [Pseudogymnoascus sp. 23342-1-I1]